MNYWTESATVVETNDEGFIILDEEVEVDDPGADDDCGDY